MSTVRDGVELAKTLESESINTYEIYQAMTEHHSLQRMLDALIEGGRTRIADLAGFEQRYGLDGIADLNKEAALEVDDLRIAQIVDAGMEYTDFLAMICEREENVAVLYDRLAAVISERAPQHALKRLAEDKRKQLWLVKSRLELEQM